MNRQAWLWIARASGEMLKRVPLDLGIALPVHYEIEKYSAQLVAWAKKARQCLMLTSEIVV